MGIQLGNFPPSPIISVILSPNILLRIFFTNILCLFSCIRVRHQVQHPYKGFIICLFRPITFFFTCILVMRHEHLSTSLRVCYVIFAKVFIYSSNKLMLIRILGWGLAIGIYLFLHSHILCLTFGDSCFSVSCPVMPLLQGSETN